MIGWRDRYHKLRMVKGSGSNTVFAVQGFWWSGPRGEKQGAGLDRGSEVPKASVCYGSNYRVSKSSLEK